MEITLELIFWVAITIGSILYLGIGTIILIMTDFLIDPATSPPYPLGTRFFGIIFWPVIAIAYIIIGSKE